MKGKHFIMVLVFTVVFVVNLNAANYIFKNQNGIFVNMQTRVAYTNVFGKTYFFDIKNVDLEYLATYVNGQDLTLVVYKDPNKKSNFKIEEKENEITLNDINGNEICKIKKIVNGLNLFLIKSCKNVIFNSGFKDVVVFEEEDGDVWLLDIQSDIFLPINY